MVRGPLYAPDHMLVLVERRAVDEYPGPVIPRGRLRGHDVRQAARVSLDHRPRHGVREAVHVGGPAPRVAVVPGIRLADLVLRRRHVPVELGEVLQGLLDEGVHTNVRLLLVTRIEVFVDQVLLVARTRVCVAVCVSYKADRMNS